MTPDAQLVEDLGSEDRRLQRSACDAVREKIGTEPEWKRVLQDLLGSPDPIARFSAAWVLAHAGHDDLRLLPALLDSLELEDGDLRWSATHLLVTLGHRHPEVYPVLLQVTAEAGSSAMRRRMALYALRELAPDRVETAAAFRAALDDASDEVRRAALVSFGKLLEPGKQGVARAIEIARADRDERLRRIAVAVLPDLAQREVELRDAIATLLGTLSSDPDASLAQAARMAASRLLHGDGRCE